MTPETRAPNVFVGFADRGGYFYEWRGIKVAGRYPLIYRAQTKAALANLLADYARAEILDEYRVRALDAVAVLDAEVVAEGVRP